VDTKKISSAVAAGSPFSPGLTYMILSAASFCFMTVFVKLAGSSLSTIQIVFVRGTFTLIATGILIFKEKIYPFGNHKKLLAARGIIGTLALFLVYESIKRFPLSEATVIQYLFPIFTALVAALIISEPLNKNIFGAIILGLFGVYTVLGFPFLITETNINLYSIGIAIAGSFLTGVAYVLVRQATKVNEHPLVVMFYFPLFTVPMSLPLLLSNWVHPTLGEWGFLLLVGVCTQLGQFFLTHGYKELPAAKAAPLSYVQVPFAMIMGAIIFEEVISLTFIIGSLLVLLSIFIVMLKRLEK
jgi:drug/metabolite transporter (DMT)-like permease|tara:strand:+ start:51 stop:950 length:900 start_codon:yes stop_codon:yes gene_type:complete